MVIKIIMQRGKAFSMQAMKTVCLWLMEFEDILTPIFCTSVVSFIHIEIQSSAIQGRNFRSN